MRIIISITTLLFVLTSCGSFKKASTSHKSNSRNYSSTSSKKQQVVDYAKSYIGTRYRYGGCDAKGMDCSGLVYSAFKQVDVKLPRVSTEISKYGKSVKISQIAPGDLVFFKTSKKIGKSVNHVGVVSNSKGGVVRFVHSSTSKGVIESRLDNPYWKKTYKFAKRVL